jgi:hypothetical protein
MIRASRSIVYSAKAYVLGVIPVKRVTDTTLALFDVADTLPQCGLQVDRPAVLEEESGEGPVGPAPGSPACCHLRAGRERSGLLIEPNALAGHRGILPARTAAERCDGHCDCRASGDRRTESNADVELLR